MKTYNNAGQARFREKKFEILVSEYSELSKMSRNVIFSWRPGARARARARVCVCVCVCVCVYV